VIGSDGEMIGVLSRDEALAKAEEEGLETLLIVQAPKGGKILAAMPRQTLLARP